MPLSMIFVNIGVPFGVSDVIYCPGYLVYSECFFLTDIIIYDPGDLRYYLNGSFSAVFSDRRYILSEGKRI